MSKELKRNDLSEAERKGLEWLASKACSAPDLKDNPAKACLGYMARLESLPAPEPKGLTLEEVDDVINAEPLQGWHEKPSEYAKRIIGCIQSRLSQVISDDVETPQGGFQAENDTP